MRAGLNVLFDEDNKMKMDRTVNYPTNERVNNSLVGVWQFCFKWTETKLVVTKKTQMSSSPAVYGPGSHSTTPPSPSTSQGAVIA